MRASGASELRNFSHFDVLKLVFLSIFVSSLDTLSVQTTRLSTYMYQQILYGLYRQHTDIWEIHVRASELRKCSLLTFQN